MPDSKVNKKLKNAILGYKKAERDGADAETLANLQAKIAQARLEKELEKLK